MIRFLSSLLICTHSQRRVFLTLDHPICKCTFIFQWDEGDPSFFKVKDVTFKGSLDLQLVVSLTAGHVSFTATSGQASLLILNGQDQDSLAE